MTQDERWMIQYKEAMEFMEREHRKPSKYYPEEKLKFHFIHHNKKLYNAGTLKAERMSKFKELVYLCEANRHANQYV